MAAEGEKSKDFYGVLGLKKECTVAELRIAYKKLAMKWHPDRCLVSGNNKQAEESKTKFQAIQEAYSVLSDSNKRFLYDVGVFNSEDEEDQNGMGDFLNEMATMMSQNKPSENGGESFEELQKLFEEIFQTDDVDTFGSSSSSWSSTTSNSSSYSFFSSQCYDPYTAATNNKRDSSHMTPNASKDKTTNHLEGFNIGAGHQGNTRTRRGLEDREQRRRRGWSRRHGKNQKGSFFCHEVSSK